MDGDAGPYQRMVTSLRQTFTQRLPAGLTPAADARLARTVSHYLREVLGAKGVIDEQEILRESYDSMAGWFRRNTEHLSPATESFADPLQSSSQRPLRTIPVPSPHSMPELQPIETRAPAERTGQTPAVLQKQEDVIKFRDTEFNLIISSKDRDWLNGPTTQNRYNFSVQFDTTRPQKTAVMPTLMQKLRNIVRVEFVKAILPVESLRPVLPRVCSGTAGTCQVTGTNSFYSILSQPTVSVLMGEYTGNNVGTANAIDRALAVCQYDATWRSDHGATNASRGFAVVIPKFLKAQRTYAPTPLANFQRLSFQLLDANDQQLSTCPDSNRLASVLWGWDVSGSCYADPSGSYLFLQTKEYFPVWAYSLLDNVLVDGWTAPSVPGVRELREWLQQPAGHVVVGVGYGEYEGAGATPIVISDGGNSCGYANFVIVRNRFLDPTGGGCALNPFTDDDHAFATTVREISQLEQGGGLLNLSRQVQLTLRVITRDFDSASNLRPDNV